jgi:arabinose-5-phosphate isomerase
MTDAIGPDAVKALFQEQHGFLNHFFDKCDYEQIAAFCRSVLETKGTVFFSGVGKSGFIGQKISMTLVSTGTKSVFLSPTDALHGDIGILTPDDLLVLLSKSGSTEELLKLIPYARAKGAKLVGVHSQPGCKLALATDQDVHLPLMRELCPFDLAPVTSTAIQMLFGDTCAVAIMQAKKLTMDEYAMNHPAGRIGKRLILKVGDVMKKKDDLPISSADASLMSELVKLSSAGVGCLLITDAAGKLEGVFTDGDLRRNLNAKGGDVLEMKIGELMCKTPRVVSPSMKAVEAMAAMEKPTPVTFMPVVEDGKLQGLITLHTLVSAGL